MDILSLPQELLSNILSFLHPQDIIQFGHTCKDAHRFINSSNQILWRSAFLHIFDDPKDAWSLTPSSTTYQSKTTKWDWHRELVQRLSALRAIRSKWCAADEQSRAEDHLDALLNIIDTAKFAPTAQDIANGRVPLEDDRYLSLNMQILADTDQFRSGLENLIHDCGTLGYMRYAGSDGNPWNSPRRPVTRSMTWSENERNRPESASRLHVMFGLTVRERIEHKARGAARRKVYDWALSGPDNDYGPFKRDGSGKVDWSLLEGVHSVIARNFAMCVEGHISMPQGFCFSIPHRTLQDPTTPADWAGVTGSWLGTYSFLDYADLYAFNTWDEQLGARPTLDDEPEACGDLMKLELNLDDNLSSDPRLQTVLPVSHDLPVLYFSGLSRANSGMHRPVIGVRGTASLVPGGREVRWRFLISYAGHDQWQLEGVQPGGIRSGGVFGLWSQCDHEDNGPVGPFCYFPMELCKPTSIVLVS
ncbi:hypothetical protein LTR10_017860 [Elasticomyces elasticus]|uniref:F-box domain-containing protein n=1 Tax=Exophiala sideris TaxID=1016849 RepID=A0ABR0J0S7_9EURO|nr:hypothetical protein LTR10_017860 [Elasticomyces elasticus]KAK5023861.1 hypothetical protein LTS07_008986 [Exophiala sideris]KAK5030121.1 hypothetical protein LTR13_008434 [Exophiala sideris]KAK5053616.1 hypothetical protein LTR69_009261 [Exophiala sideris]KAK5179342.1 hypothetical protein LTR44_008180 [Eurotiomycetes sp. CCFEE 6388]